LVLSVHEKNIRNHKLRDKVR